MSGLALTTVCVSHMGNCFCHREGDDHVACGSTQGAITQGFSSAFSPSLWFALMCRRRASAWGSVLPLREPLSLSQHDTTENGALHVADWGKWGDMFEVVGDKI